MEDAEGSEIREPASKSFLRRFKFRDVQATFGSLKRSVSLRGSKRDPLPEPPQTEEERYIPPYKELYFQKKTAETVLNELHDGYFEKDFDPIDFELRNVDDDVGQEEVDAKVDKLTVALEVVSLQLSKRVMEKQNHFADGIETVGSIESDLQQAHVSTVNARLRVRLALEEVKRSAAIACDTRQKQRYMEVLNLLTSVKQAAKLKQSVRDVLENGDYIEAMMMCADCFEKLETLGNIKIALDLKQSVHSLYLETIDRIDAALHATCNDFRPDEYKNILQCFLFQDITVNELSDKILRAFQDSIAKASSRVVRSLIVTKPGLADAMFSPKFETSFSEMCRGLPFDLLRPCLAKLLEVLFDILCSYHCMSTWHEIGLKHAQSELQRVQQSKTVAETTDEAGEDIDEDVESAQRTVNVLTSVLEVLVESRKVIWDSAARRVRDLLSGPAAVEGEHFLQVMEWCQKFLRAGEAFIRDKSDLLRSIITIQCGKFFQSYHGTNLDALEMMLGSEQFLNVSIQDSKSKESELYGSMLSAVMDREESDPFAIDASFDVSDFDAWIDRGNPFRASLASQKERRRRPVESDIVLGFGGASNMDDDVAAQRLEVDYRGHTNGMGVWSSDSMSTAQTLSRKGTDLMEEEYEEEEDPEVYGQDIDEETQTVRMDVSTTSPSESTGIPEVILTNSARQILKWLKNYCALLKPLSLKAEDIFNGMCDLYDGYFLDVFLFVGGISLYQLVWEEDLITTRLRSTLLRILKTEGHKHKEEIERIEVMKPSTRTISPAQHKFTFEIKSFAHRFNASKASASSATAANGSQPGFFGTGGSPRVSTLSNHQAALLSMNNMYGLRETVVAVGSVQLLSKELTNAKSKIQSLLPTAANRSVENYFSRTVDATEDLRECAFRNAARRMLHAVFDPEKGIAAQIASTSYDAEEPSDSHNAWAHGLGEHISRFSEAINYTKLPDDMVSQMWEHAIKACSEVILDGLSMVKRCTMPGRSMMSLDLSYVESNFKFMVPAHVLVNLRIVDAYIKAFYLPWEDLPKWVEVNHAEYGRTRIMTLFNLIVDRVNSMEGRNLKKAEIRAMVSQIDASIQHI